MIVPIKTIHDLRNEIVRLETLNVQQEATLKQRFSSPSAIYKSFLSLIPKSSTTTNSGKPAKFVGLNAIFNQDVVGLISRYLLPLTLNKTLFRGSGFITRSIVTFLSEKASGYINEESVTNGWDKVKSTVLSKVKIPESFWDKLKSKPKKSIKVNTNLPVVIKDTSTPVVIRNID